MAHVQPLFGFLTILIIITGCAGQTSNNACGGNLTAQAGTVISPNFPNGYPDVVTCRWTITVAENQIITLRFHTFEVDNSDNVLCYDGDSTRYPVISETLKGYWPDSKVSNFRIRTTGHSLHIVFTSNGALSGPGFSASYWAHECAPFTYGIDYCDKNCTCQAENSLYCNGSTGQCVCKGGWQSTRCDVDVDECNNPNMCPDLYSHCVNTKGSYSCVCKTGLQLNATGNCSSSCTQQNKCSHACGVTSTNPYIEQCHCPKGMQLKSTNNQTCVECGDWFYGEDCKFRSSCHTYNTKVLNKANGLCTCYLNWTSTNCAADVNECNVISCNITDSYCQNTFGSFQCRCYNGYEIVNETMCKVTDCEKTLNSSSGVISSNYNYFSQFIGATICSWIISVEKGLVIDLRFTTFNLYIGYNSPSGYVRIFDGLNATAPLLGQFDGLNYHNGRLPANYVRSSGNTMYITQTLKNPNFAFSSTYTSHECKAFFYDTNCSTPCNCNKNNTDYCNSTTGQCMCKPQWTSPDCTVDKNECLVDPLACPNYSDCTNLQPGYQCDCKMGLERDDKGHCIHSLNNSATCKLRNCSHYCVHLNESTEEHCYCPTGMALHGDTCVNCPNGTFGPDCSFKCACVESNTASCDHVTGQCVCVPGWTSDNCSQDIDECYYDLYICPIYSTCTNTPGDYDCICDNNAGYENAANRTCKPIECRYVLTNSSGVIASPNFPNMYYNNANCSWLIGVDAGMVITLRFDVFTTQVCCDFVTIYNGNSTRASIISRNSGELKSVKRIIRSTGNRIFISFVSDKSLTYAGFRATYISHHCPNGTFGPDCSFKCACVESNTASCDHVTGQCVCLPGWTSDNCSQDMDECNLALYICPFYSTCTNTPGDYDCICNKNAGYENATNRTCKPIECRYVLTNSSGVIASPNFPNSYYNNANCSWLIEVDAGMVITLRFDDFSTEFCCDFVTIYNGNSTRSSIIGRNSGELKSIKQNTRATGNRMFISFVSDSIFTYAGFRATYISHPCRTFTFGDTCSEYCHCIRENTQFCDNFKGECLCKAGWKGNTCFDDVNECLGTNNALCPTNSVCQNTQGSYGCICNAGFLKNVSNNQCEAYNGCYKKICSHGCYLNKDLEETCSCPDGLELDVSGLTCVVPYYPYGLEANDHKLSPETQSQSFYQETILVSSAIDFSSGVPFGYSGKMIKDAYVLSNGLIAFGEGSLHISSSPNLQHASLQDLKVVAPYWADIDPKSGYVNYHLYEKCGQAAFDGTKDDVTSPLKAKVLSRAQKDLIKYYNLAGFEVDSVLVVSWVGVQPFSHSYEKQEKNTFQAVFISGWENDYQNGQEILSGEETSYVIFLYQQGQMNWTYVPGRLINIGFTGHIMPDTDKTSVNTLDKVKGNTGFNGVFTYKTGSSSSSIQRGHRYTCSKIDLLSNPVYENEKRTLYECPSTMERLGAQWRLYEMRGEQNEIECYAISQVAKSRLLASNKRNKLCCYKRDKPKNPNNWRDVEQTMRAASYVPESGHVIINDPWSLNYFDNYEARKNIEAHKICCTKSTKNLCDRFYKIFPDMGCSNFVVFVPRSALGDPHITTLDGITYTMNGWGEYSLMDIKSENFTLQARTSRIESINGTLINATVFTAFAAKEGDYARLHVQLATNNKTLVIYVNERDITNEFANDETFYHELDKISITRNDIANKTFAIATFACGVTIKVYAAIKSLNIELEVDKRLENKTLGLFGNFNQNKSDEFTLQKGTVLPSSMSEREIFYLFGKKWEVTPTNTVFKYENKENSSTYQHSDFVPVFVDEASPSMVAKAEKYCGNNNSACVFDYIVTESEEFALSTNDSFLKLKSLVTNLENNPPTLSLKNTSFNGFDQWVVNEQIQATLEVLTEDADGDLVYVETIDNPNGVIVKDKSIIYTANSSLPIKLGLRAKDSKGAYGSIVYVSIAVCTNCHGHGKCTNITRDTEYSDGYFQIFECSCFPAYTGSDCESEMDACASKPCSVGQECRDLTAAQQGNNVTGYVCGSCPVGYIKSNSIDKCIDIDECLNNDCQHNCTNTIGSYQCGCRDGFRLDLIGLKTCKDINECEEQTSQCQHSCKNTEGSYNCSCLEGYDMKADGHTCELSSSWLQKCSHCQHTCIFNKLNNSAICTCDKGYLQDEKNDAECLDIDECKLDNMPCSQGCNNTDGNFHCYCYPGYKLESDSVSCKACEVPYYGDNCNKTCDCNGRGSCNTVKGCVCDVNWAGVNCDIDVDECAKPGACPEGQLCKNTNGSFTCSCPTGYSMDESVCKDVDECLSLQINETCTLQTEVCINTVGSYRCECKHGYARDNKSICQDINECKLRTDQCQQLCHNVDGGYNCGCETEYILADNRQICTKVQDICDGAKLNCTHGCSLDDNDKPYCICPRGYSRIIQIGKVTCLDINECASAENNSCSYKTGCNNTDGGYTCSCPSGFKLDNNGRNCLACSGDTWGVSCAYNCTCGIGAERCDPVKGCVCKTGYTGEHCQNDINECTTGNLTCEERQVCVNLPGSAMCVCQAGYQFDRLSSCLDINECSGNNNCTQVCTNTEGSYRCSCYAGYTYNSTSNTCLDIDECKLGKNQCDKICTNTDGSYRCSCTEGLFLQLDGVSCGADKQCKTSQCAENCANINGIDTCLCGKGKTLAKDNTSCDDLDLCKLSSCSEGCIETKGNKTFECLCNIGKYLAADEITCTECIDGRYGMNCNKSCTCQIPNTKTCDNVNGTCICLPGWKGQNCTIDIDECADNSGSCHEHSHCVNTNGSYICVCDDGFIQKDKMCAECIDGRYGMNCNKSCTCQMSNTKTCDNVNGTCICLPGWKGQNCTIDIDECANNSGSCQEHSHCVNTNGSYICVCDDGFIQKDKMCAECDENWYGPVCSSPCSCGEHFKCNKTNGSCYCKPGWRGDNCEIDINECTEETHDCNSTQHQVCENSLGGYQCVCQTGYTKQCDACDCQERPSRHTVSSIITLDYTSGFDLTDKKSNKYQELLVEAQKGLFESLKKKETAVISVNVTNLSQGSLIIETDITMATNNTTDKESALRLSRVLVEIMQDGIGITINNTVGVILHLNISGIEIQSTDTPCNIKRKIDPCSDSDLCVEEGKEATCRSQEKRDNLKLILGLSIGLSLFVLLCITIIVVVCYCKRNKKKMERFEPHVNRTVSIPDDLYNSEKTQVSSVKM